MCRAQNVLPNAGGLLDQDPMWVERMEQVFEIIAEKERIESEKAEKKRSRARH